MYLYTCLCIPVSVYIYVYACICLHVSVYQYLYTYTCMPVSVYMYLYTCICMPVSVYLYLYACICIHVTVPDSRTKHETLASKIYRISCSQTLIQVTSSSFRTDLRLTAYTKSNSTGNRLTGNSIYTRLQIQNTDTDIVLRILMHTDR
jgi:hypothetical protein